MGAQEQLALHVHTIAADLGEPGGDDHQPLDALASTGIDGIDALRGRNRQDREVDRTLDRFDVRRAAEAEQRSGVRVDRVHRPFEAALHEVADHRVPDAVGIAARSDDRDGSRLQNSRNAVHACGPCASLACGERVAGRFDVECEMHDPVLDGSALAPEARGLKDLEHLPVVDERIGTESGDAEGRCVGREVLEEQRRKPAALVLVGDCKCDLGLIAREAVIATDGDHGVTQERDEGHAVVVVDAREVGDLAVAQLRSWSEEAEVHAPLGLAREERPVSGRVVRADGPDVHRAAVGEHCVDGP